jgi:ligand-binding sensor domain-containing protein
MRHSTFLTALLSSTLLSAQVFTTYTTVDGLPTNNLRDVAVASDGGIWLATQAGVCMFDGNSFTTHNTVSHPGLASDDVVAIAVTANGDVWAGTDVGVSVFDGAGYTTYTTADGLSDDQIANIKQAPNGDVWMGTINGATRYSNGTFTAFTSPDIPFGGVQYIAFAANGDVWLGGGLGGVIIYDGSTFTTLTTANGLLSNKVRSIAFDGAQNKWVATAKGISTFDAADQHTGDHTRPFVLPAPDTLNPVTDIVLDSQGRVWAGVYVDYLVTEGGVSTYDGFGWTQYETADGLAGPNVRRLAVDADDAVWVTTSTGLTKISGVVNSIVEDRTDAGFALNPNPAASELFVVAEDRIASRIDLEVYDAQLRLVLTRNILGGRGSVDVSALAAGTYIAKLNGGTQRFVVVR